MSVFFVLLPLATGFLNAGLTADEQQYLAGFIRARDRRIDTLNRDIAVWQDQLKPPRKGTSNKKSPVTRTMPRDGGLGSINLATPPRPGTKQHREYLRAVKEKIDDLEKELRRVQSGEWEPPPSFPYVISDHEPGAVRQLGPVEILQVLGPTEALITFRQGEHYSKVLDQIFWLKDISTAKMADGQPFRFEDCVIVEGTKTYTTAAGATRTVFVLRPAKVDREKVLAEYRAQTKASAPPEEPAEPRTPPKSATPSQSTDPDAAARKRFTALLKNSRALIKAGVRDAAEQNLRRIVSEAPGTSIAAEAKKELDELSGRHPANDAPPK
jgi:hypothetical protein